LVFDDVDERLDRWWKCLASVRHVGECFELRRQILGGLMVVMWLVVSLWVQLCLHDVKVVLGNRRKKQAG
jgi:hypothetical protein